MWYLVNDFDTDLFIVRELLHQLDDFIDDVLWAFVNASQFHLQGLVDDLFAQI